MTRSILSIINILLFSTLLFAAEPPGAVQKAFVGKFPTATKITWGKENSKEWEAEFTLNGTAVSANFSNKGIWMETESKILLSELPAAVSSSITQHYPKYNIVSVYRIESPERPITYEADIRYGKTKKEILVLEDGALKK